jgi:hypothetical protein
MMPWEKYQTQSAPSNGGAKPWEKYGAAPKPQIQINPTDGMSTGQRLAAGAGSAVTDAGLGAKQALTEYGNKQTLGQQLSPQQQMTLLYSGKNLDGKLIPDSAVSDVQSQVDEKRRMDAPLMNTGAGKTGSVLGNIAMTVPALAIPGANTYAGAGLMGGLMGMVQPTAEGESRGVNTVLGATTSLAGQGAGSMIGKTAKAAAGKVAKIESDVAAKAATQAASETASARSAAGNAAQNAYRQLEHLRELNAKGLLTAEGKKAAKALEKELAGKAAEKLLPAAAAKETTAKAYQEAIETEADRAAKLTSEKLSGNEVKSQIMARVKRYGPAALGGMVGNMIFPGLGGMAGGAATGLTLRPALRSIMNLTKNPAVQRQMLMPIANSTLANNPNLPLALALMGSSVYAGQQ